MKKIRVHGAAVISRVNRVTVLAIKTIKLLESIGTGHRSNLPSRLVYFSFFFFFFVLSPSPLFISLSIRATNDENDGSKLRRFQSMIALRVTNKSANAKSQPSDSRLRWPRGFLQFSFSPTLYYSLSFKCICKTNNKPVKSLLNNFYPVISHRRAQKESVEFVVYGLVTRYGPQSAASASD